MIDDAGTGLGEHSVRWSEIERVTAFKIDAYVYDIIVLRLITPGGVFDVTEEDQGWSGLLERLPAYLPECMRGDQMLEAVTLPPFATNTTEVYSRAK